MEAEAEADPEAEAEAEAEAEVEAVAEAEAVAVAERENRDGKIGSGAVPPIPLDAPVLREHYKLREVLETNHILGPQYCRSIVDSMSEAPGDIISGVG